MSNKDPPVVAPLPGFMQSALDADKSEITLLPYHNKAMEFSKTVGSINKLLQNKAQKTKHRKPIHIGQDIIRNANELKNDLELISLPDYFASVEGLLALAFKVVTDNSHSMHNPVLVKHMKNVINTVLTETRVMDIANALLQKFLVGDMDDEDGGDDDNDPTPPMPLAG